MQKTHPNLVFVFADQWRAQATGYAGNPTVKTPNLDRLAAENVVFTNAVSNTPVCSPYRASLMTGMYPHRHGVMINDVSLYDNLQRHNVPVTYIAQSFKQAGYDTAYIGKWHIDGHGRAGYIPEERRLGFDYWKVLECTHDYNRSRYYAGNDDTIRIWDGYDADAQTRDAISFLQSRRDARKPFVLFLSWGPPHNPYHTAPKRFRDRIDPDTIVLRKNVPAAVEADARHDLAGYYAHCSALDDNLGHLTEALRVTGLADNTIFAFTSDHGDMLGSHGESRKQKLWDESILVPFVLRHPDMPPTRTDIASPINAPDIMPTLLGLCNVPIPESAAGVDFSNRILNGDSTGVPNAALIACYTPFGEWRRENGGKEYRGIRTARHTYVRDRNGPWCLFDNAVDPFQLTNLVDQPDTATLQSQLDDTLNRMLKETGDDFLAGEDYIRQWGHVVDEHNTADTRD